MDPIAAISITGAVISTAASAVSVMSGIIAVKSAKSPVTIRMEEPSKKEADHAISNINGSDIDTSDRPTGITTSETGEK